MYALCSWLALIYKEQALYFNVFREAYEALCIYSFFGFLVGYLGGEENIVHHISAKPQQAHTAPVRWFCVADWPMGPAFFLNCKHGCLQYVVIQFVLSIAKFVLHFIPTGDADPNYTLFHESHWTWVNRCVLSCAPKYFLCHSRRFQVPTELLTVHNLFLFFASKSFKQDM